MRRWLRSLWEFIRGRGRQVRGFFTLNGGEIVATVMMTGQQQDHRFEAVYVRNGAPATPDAGGRLTMSPHTLPPGSSVEVLPDGLSIRVRSGPTVGTGVVRGTVLVNGAPVEAVLEVDVVGGAVAGQFVAVGPPVDA